jgi:integrase
MTEKVNLTAGRVAEFRCPPGKGQAFLADLKSPWLSIRATESGAKSYVFESKLDRVSIRITIGRVAAWSIDAARIRANELKTLVDRGIDPRLQMQQGRSTRENAGPADQPPEVCVAVAWADYLARGKPKKKDLWKPRYRLDLERAAAPGGIPLRRGKGLTKPGPLFSLMSMPLSSITDEVIRAWFQAQATRGRAQAGRALAMFSGFLQWCGRETEYKKLVNKDAAKPSEHADLLPRSTFRRDSIRASQLPAWFRAAAEEPNRIGAAYLIGLLLTGARREELARLRHDEIDWHWNQTEIADKVEQTRRIPVAPYVKRMILELPRRDGNPYVFWSETAAEGYIAEPRSVLHRVLGRAGIGHVSVHGLRRTFSKLAEAAGVPAGAIAQIMGHQPSALAERYRFREMDVLAAYLAKAELFILEAAGVLAQSNRTSEAANEVGRGGASTVHVA